MDPDHTAPNRSNRSGLIGVYSVCIKKYSLMHLNICSRGNKQTTFSGQKYWILDPISGRVLDSRSRDHRFESHQSHCLVSLSKTLNSLISTGSTQEKSQNE